LCSLIIFDVEFRFQKRPPFSEAHFHFQKRSCDFENASRAGPQVSGPLSIDLRGR
jgi:hypothetical protein